MFDTPVLGVDPGLAASGLAVVAARGARPEVTWLETVRTPATFPEPLRLRRLFAAVTSAIAGHRPVAVAVERLIWGRNAGSAMTVARATGVVLLAAAEAGVPVEEYAPLEVKMAITGVGNATKEQVRRGLERAYGVEPLRGQPDALDAVAVGLCHLQQSKLRSSWRRAVSS